MLESAFKTKLVKQINSLGEGAYATRLEDKNRVGLLDMILILPNQPVAWAEGKLVRGFQFGPTPKQYYDGKRLIAAGQVVLLIAWRDGEMGVHEWAEQAHWKDCFRASGKDYAGTLNAYLNLVARTRVA